MRSGLPIDEALEPLRAALATGRNAVVEAPPGAGKSTVVPLALLDEPWARGKRIRDARAAPARDARGRRCAWPRRSARAPGDTVGYRMRLETRVSRARASRSSPKACSRGCCKAIRRSKASRRCCSTSFTSAACNADIGLALALDAHGTSRRSFACSRCRRRSTARGREAARRRTRDRDVGPRVSGRDALRRHRPAAAARRRRRAGRRGRCARRHSAHCATRRRRARVPARARARSAACTRGCSRPIVGTRRRRAAAVRRARGRRAGRGARAGASRAAARSCSRRTSPRRVSRSTAFASSSMRGSSGAASSIPASGMSRLEAQRISRASAEQRAGRAGRTAPGVVLSAVERERRAQPRRVRAAGNLRRRPRAAGARSRGLGHGGRRYCAGSMRRRPRRSRARAICCAGSARSTRPAASPRTAARCSDSPRIRGSRTCCSKARELGAGRPRRSSRRCSRIAICCAGPARGAHATATSAPGSTRCAAAGGSTSIAARSSACAARSARFDSSSGARGKRAAVRRRRRRACCSRSRTPTASRAPARRRGALPARERPRRVVRRARSRSRARSSSSRWISTTASARRASSSRRRSTSGDPLELFADAARSRTTSSPGTSARRP